MFKFIEKLADKTLSRIVPKVDASAYKTGCNGFLCDAYYCSDWECCRLGSSFRWKRTCPRSPGTPGNCAISFSGYC